MTVNPKISIIVPVYNTESYLEECLDSILAQTLKDIEIICVNDGSPDHSQDILERYAQKDKRVKVLVKENGGLSSARNAGMKIAEGEYIAFVDSDDFVAPEMMETLYTRAEETKSDITIGDLYLYDQKTGETRDYRDQMLFLRLKNRVVALEECPELIRCIAAWDRIYRRCFLDEIGAQFPEGLVYEDAIFTAKTVTRTKRIAVVPQKLYYYRKNVEESITGKEAKNDRYKSDFLEIQRLIRTVLREEKVSEEVFFEYMLYFLPNAFSFQGNATNCRFFKSFFRQIREMMSEEEYEMTEDIENPGLRRYVRYIKQNQVFRCWCYFKLRKLAKRIRKF